LLNVQLQALEDGIKEENCGERERQVVEGMISLIREGYEDFSKEASEIPALIKSGGKHEADFEETDEWLKEIYDSLNSGTSFFDQDEEYLLRERVFSEALKNELNFIIDRAAGEDGPELTAYRMQRLCSHQSQMTAEVSALFQKLACSGEIYSEAEGLEAEIPDVSVTDEDINRELEGIRERNAIVLDKNDDENAVNDDVVTVNFSEIGDNGEVFAETEREDFVFTLGSGYNLYEFDDEMIGMKKGETKELEKSYPEDHTNKDLAGKTKKLKVTLTALKQKKLPELDDDLAQDVDVKFETLEDLKNNIRERLSGNLEQKLREIKINLLLKMIMEITPVVIPESMVRLELDSRWRNLARRFNTDSEGLMGIMGQGAQNIQAILDQWRPDVVRALHSRLIVETLMNKLKLETTDEDLEKKFDDIAGSDEGVKEEIRERYTKEGMVEYLKEDIKEQKLFDILFEKNTIKPGNKANYVDLMAKND
jgi:trigger factor